MANSNQETLSLGWCDNGMVDGKFAEGIMYTTVTAPTQKMAINNVIRVQGHRRRGHRDERREVPDRRFQVADPTEGVA
jgi:hypothetical protein